MAKKKRDTEGINEESLLIYPQSAPLKDAIQHTIQFTNRMKE